MPDAITARAGTTFPIIPEGDYQAVCVDVIDLGHHLNEKYVQIQPKCALVFQIEGEDGKRHEVAERFTVSMGEKARLRTFLESWRGRPYKPEQLDDGIPLDKLTGQGGNVVIVHNTSGTKTYANIFSIRPLAKSDVPLKPHPYARQAYWDKVIAKAVPQGGTIERGADDEMPLDEGADDLPF